MKAIVNPILRGFHPDPCLCEARGKYYLATSTFQWLPAVSLYESSDLVEWSPVGGALPELDLRGIPDSAGVWAPDLTFDGERFWLVYTVARQIDGIYKDVSNFVVTAKSIEGPWTEPVFINASGFDPGMFHEDGRHYVLNPQWDPRPLAGHHRFNGLIMQEFSLERGLMGEPRVVLGNSDAVNWLREGPHIMKREGWYLIACAEGGTGRRHRIRMARSRSLWGPYGVCPEPLVCAWCTSSPLRKAGHGNIIQGPDGGWYACFLCARYLPDGNKPNVAFDESEEGVSPLGRETALAPVIWEEGWPCLAEGGFEPKLVYGEPGEKRKLKPGDAGYRYETDFSAYEALWQEEWLAPRRMPVVLPGAHGLTLAGGDSPSSRFDRSSLSRRATSFSYRATTEVESFEPSHYNQSAGLIVEYDSRSFVYLHQTWDEERRCRVIDVLVNDNGEFAMPANRVSVPADDVTVLLGVDVVEGALRLFYSFDHGEEQWIECPDGVLVLDASAMSDEHVAGWTYTGTMVGITCVDMFDKSARATFGSFVYEDR